jgi:SAM-dependent methyltransferase
MTAPPESADDGDAMKNDLNWNPVTHYTDAQVAASYDAERFDSFAASVYQRLERNALLKAFRGIPRGTLVLDLPCGTGRLAEHLLVAGYDIVGADISDPMLQQACHKLRRFGGRFTVKVVDARNAAGIGRTFHAALCARVLMHFPLEQQIEFLAGVAQAVDRYVVITQSLDSYYQRLRRRIKKSIFNGEPAAYPISSSELQSLLDGAGLKQIGLWRISRVLSEAIVVLAEKRNWASRD